MDDMKTVADIRRDNLSWLAEKAGGISALNSTLGRSARDSTFNQIINRSPNSKGGAPKSMGARMARSIEAALDLPEGWMDTRHDDNAAVRGLSLLDKQTGIVTIPRYDTGGSMGDGIVLHDQPGVIESWRVTKEWLASNVRGYTSVKNLCIVTGFGDSMRPTYNPGDPLIVDKGISTVEFDSVYFFRVGNNGYVKRLQRIPTAEGLVIKALSDNRDLYEPFDITSDMDFAVLGRIVQVWRREDY